MNMENSWTLSHGPYPCLAGYYIDTNKAAYLAPVGSLLINRNIY